MTVDAVKLFISTVAGGLLAYLQPVFNPMQALAFVFLADIAFGILVDIIRNSDRIRLRKLLVSSGFLTMYILVIAGTYTVGERMNDSEEALYVVKTFTYVFIYFYTTNILRNMHELAPASQAIAFIDYFVGLQVLRRLPELSGFLNRRKRKGRNSHEQA